MSSKSRRGQQQPPRPPDRQRGAHHQNETNSPAAVRQVHSDGNHDHADQKQRSGRIFTKTLETIGILLVIITAGSTALQLGVNRESEHRQLRAYLGMEDIKLNCCEAVAHYETNGQESTHTMAVTIKNGGQTPASEVRVNMAFTEIAKLAPFPDAMPIPNIAGVAIPAGSTVTASLYMLPGDVAKFYAGVDDLMFMRARARMSDVIVVGTVTYVDTFYQHRVTDFCRVYQRYASDTDGYPACARNNGDREQRKPWYYWIFPIE